MKLINSSPISIINIIHFIAVARRTSETPNSNHAEEFACKLSHLKENNQGPMKDSCGSSITNDVGSGGVDDDTMNFPPLPTQDQLKAEVNQVIKK